MTLTLDWWIIPTTITLVGILWALLANDNSAPMGGIKSYLMLVPALAISNLAWIITAILR